jgi:ABC-type transport system substrate-binding protein
VAVNDSVIDAAIAKGKTTTDLNERKAAYAPLFKKIATENMKWWLPVVGSPVPVVYRPEVKGFKLGQGGLLFEQMWLSTKS